MVVAFGRVCVAPIRASGVASVHQSSLDQHILQRLAGHRVQLMFTFLEFKQDGTGPSAIGFFGGSNGCHLSLLDKALAMKQRLIDEVETLVEERGCCQSTICPWHSDGVLIVDPLPGVMSTLTEDAAATLQKKLTLRVSAALLQNFQSSGICTT